MNKNRWVFGLSLLVMLASLALAARLTAPLNARRAALELTFTRKVSENLPPEIVLTQTALGSFRGLAVDYLWFRASEMQEAGQYYEAQHLAEMITLLQPRFPQVWIFQAWNMAYNLSAAVRTPEEKWSWVAAGIRLLRNEGLERSPYDVRLYRELAYIFFHKIGKFSVATHWFYKKKLAAEWHALLGAPPEGSTRAALAAFQRIAEAPATRGALVRAHPPLAEQLARLRKWGFEPDHALLRTISELQALRRWGLQRVASGPDRERIERERKLSAWLADEKIAKPRAALLAFIRSRVLRDEYRMDPAFMYALMKKYGPMDWRHPSAHAAYWAALGARRSEHLRHPDTFEVLQLDRLLLHALQSLALSGKIQFDPHTGYYSQLPEPRLFEAYETALLDAGRRQHSGGKTPRALKESHRGFLMLATEASYLYGNRQWAERYYEKLRKLYGKAYPGTYGKPLDEFVFEQLTEGLDRIETARQIIRGLLLRALADGLALGHPEVARRFFTQARKAYQHYAAQKKSHKGLELPPLSKMLDEVLIRFLLSPSGGVHPLQKRNVWEKIPRIARRRIFDRIRIPLYQQTRRAGLDPEKMFPEPPGMEEYRKEKR